jgi:anthraniloyl-CoA monooxygenase
MIELHCAHGYLLSTFLSPLTNRRTDEYGGSLDKRLAFPLEVFRAMRAAFPAHKPMSVRFSASDWAPGGTALEELPIIGRRFKEAGVDILDVSAGGNVSEQKPVYGRLFQVPFSDIVRNEADIPTMTVGNISSYTDVNGILAARRADICLIARGHLFDPYWIRHAAAHQGYGLPWPKQYGVLAHYSARFV